jgi:hypothetical protein
MNADPFRRTRETNSYDRLAVDVPALFARYPLKNAASWGRRAPRRQSRYAASILPLNFRFRSWQLLHRLRLDQSWFETFQIYWRTILEGRPLHTPDDFHFLRGVYRLRHQDNQVPDTTDAALHTAAWQQPELLYQVFFQVYLESFAPRLTPARWLKAAGASTFCEYGCATAPVTTAYRTFFGDAASAHVIDLPTVALHYAAFKFAYDRRVTVHALEAANDLLPPSDLRVDAVVCTTVFEHLLDPLAVAQRFVTMLRPSGTLIFDYMQTQGEGLDSRAGATQRADVLAFLRERFDVEHVEGGAEAGAGLTLARLK